MCRKNDCRFKKIVRLYCARLHRTSVYINVNDHYLIKSHSRTVRGDVIRVYESLQAYDIFITL